MQDAETVLNDIRQLAETALQQADLAPAVAKLLREIVVMASPGRRDTPESSDLPRTENQSL